jgi:hypothetical protein
VESTNKNLHPQVNSRSHCANLHKTHKYPIIFFWPPPAPLLSLSE